MENRSFGERQYASKSVLSQGIVRKKRTIRTIPYYRSARDGLRLFLMLRYLRYLRYLFASSSRKKVTFFKHPFLMLGYLYVFDLLLFICRIISYYRRYQGTGTSVPFSSKRYPGRDTFDTFDTFEIIIIYLHFLLFQIGW